MFQSSDSVISDRATKAANKKYQDQVAQLAKQVATANAELDSAKTALQSGSKRGGDAGALKKEYEKKLASAQARLQELTKKQKAPTSARFSADCWQESERLVSLHQRKHDKLKGLNGSLGQMKDQALQLKVQLSMQSDFKPGDSNALTLRSK